MDAALLDLDDAESDDVLDDDAEGAEADGDSTEDRWARIREDREARYWLRNRTIGRDWGHDPWEIANATDRRLATAVLVRIGENADLEHGDLAGLLGVREHEVRTAIHLLASAGRLSLSRGKWIIAGGVKA